MSVQIEALFTSALWRHLDCFQYEAWLHADVPATALSAGLTTHKV